MRTFTDEQLAAHADGELDAATAAALEAELARDAELSRRHARFAATRRVLKASFAPVVEQPVPERLLRALQAPAAAGRRRPRWQPLALAASLVVAATATLLLVRERGPGIPGLPPDPAALAYVLERLPSGSPANLYVAGSRYEVLPLSTVRAADGRWCREFESTSGSATVRARACREGEGRWVALAPGNGADPAQGPDDYRAAGADDAFPGARRVAADEEAALIARGWQDESTQ